MRICLTVCICLHLYSLHYYSFLYLFFIGSAVNVSEVTDSNPALKRIVSDSNLIARRFPGL